MISTDLVPDDPTLAPLAIAQRILDDTGRGLMEDQFGLFQSRFRIPTRLETFEAVRDISTEAELRRRYQIVRQYLTSRGITHIDRRCIEAEISGPERLSFTHETRLISRSRLVQEPYPVFTDALREDGRWKIIRKAYAIVDEPQHINALTGKE